MSAIFGKEFKNSMRTMTGPIFIAFLLFWFGIYTAKMNLEYSYSQFEYTIANASFLSLLALPLLTMRTFAEEKHSGSDRLLYALPLKTPSIVIAKYLSALAVFAIPAAVVAVYPLILSKFGVVYLNTAYSSLLAFFLVGAALIAVGVFISSLTESQVISAIMTLGVIILLFFITDLANDLPQSSTFSLVFLFILSAALSLVTWVLTKNPIASAIVLMSCVAASIIGFIVSRTSFEGLATKWLSSLDMFGRMNSFFNGKLDVTAIIYYLSITAFFLFLTVQSVEKKRWN